METIIGRLNKLEETIASGDFAKKKKNADSESNLSDLNEEDDEGTASEASQATKMSKPVVKKQD